LYNKLKHSSNEIGYGVLYNSKDLIVAYWLVGENGEGGIGPQFPVSVNLELRRIQHLIYRMSANLHTALTAHLAEVYDFVWLPTLTEIPVQPFYDLNRVIASVSELFLTNEIGNTFWQCSYGEETPGELVFNRIVIDTDKLNSDFYQQGPIEVIVEFRGDGFTRSFGLPHFGLQQVGGINMQIING